MKKPADAGPVCPGCGYAIFGLRDMRCPECGRTLDVRDFNPDGASLRGESARYERTAVAGGVMGIVLLLVLLVGLLAITGMFLRYGVLPWLFPLAIIAVVITLIRVIGQTGQSVWSLFKARKK